MPSNRQETRQYQNFHYFRSLSLVLSIVGVIMVVVGLNTEYWLVEKEHSIYFGLLKHCFFGDCARASYDEIKEFKLIYIPACLILSGVVVAGAGFILHIILPIGAAVVSSGGVLCIAGTGYFLRHALINEVYTALSFGWSFYITIVGAALLAVTGLIIVILCLVTKYPLAVCPPNVSQPANRILVVQQQQQPVHIQQPYNYHHQQQQPQLPLYEPHAINIVQQPPLYHEVMQKQTYMQGEQPPLYQQDECNSEKQVY